MGNPAFFCSNLDDLGIDMPKSSKPRRPYRPDYGLKQYHMKRLEGYRACATGVPRERNWYTPVREGTTDERGWFEGWDMAHKDGFQVLVSVITVDKD